ncbi:signal peptidase II [Candidatus Thioglobus sp.]|nr:signal peptidase II [Candidatus Thioglobus sp.]
MTQYKYYFLSLILVIADQLTKMMVLGSLKLYESIEITSFFSLTHVHNYGAAFSFLADEDGWQQYFLVSVSAIASIVLILWMRKISTNQSYKLIALSLILSGAIGNLIDRAVFGFVIDFINLHYQDFYWPVFNVADTAITLGVILLLLVDFKKDRAKS